MVTKKLFQVMVLFFLHFSAYAADADFNFSAKLDRDQITLSERVALIFSIESKTSIALGEPEYVVPVVDIQGEKKRVFRLENKMSSVSISSYYDSSSGKFSTVKKHRLTHILEPLVPGNWKISDIKMKIGSQYTDSSALQIMVSDSSSQSQQQNPNVLGKVGKNEKEKKELVFLKTEIEKKTAFKGEQVLVSYYLYYSPQIYNMEYDKFPTFTGFLKEDIEIPLLANRSLISENVEYNGRSYNRSLLARYAAYPLQEGQLTLDPLSVKVSYQTASQGDPFEGDSPFFSFFQQMAPLVIQLKSETITIEVAALPQDGKPKSFTGGIGHFEVSTKVNKQELNVNEGLSLMVQVEGKGNISSLQEPRFSLPHSLELYDTQAKVKSLKKEKGIKVFEFLIIPRIPGEYEIPSIEFSFFDPIQKNYYSKLTSSIPLKVLGVANPPLGISPNTSFTQKNVGHESGHENNSKQDSLGNQKNSKNLLQPLKKYPSLEGNSFLPPVWRILYWGFFLSLGAFVIVFGKTYFQRFFWKKNKTNLRKKSILKSFQPLLKEKMSWDEILKNYEQLKVEVIGFLEESTQLNLKAMSRNELKNLLIPSGLLDAETWQKIESLLEDCDWVKFAGSGGDELKNDAYQRLEKWIQQLPSIAENLKL